MIRPVTLLRNLVLAFFFLPVVNAAAAPVTIVAFGDSLTAGYQLPSSEAFPTQLEAALKARGHDVVVVNAGVSGDTTSSGLARLDWSVPQDADAIIIALGGNDALRALPPGATRENMDAIVQRSKEKGLAILVAGIEAPRNLGEEYTRNFDPVFAEVAEKYGALFYPSFLAGVPISPATVQADGMHPTGKGVSIIVERILPMVEALIAQVPAD